MNFDCLHCFIGKAYKFKFWYSSIYFNNSIWKWYRGWYVDSWTIVAKFSQMHVKMYFGEKKTLPVPIMAPVFFPDTAAGVLLVSGASGLGKSAFVADWLEEKRQSDDVIIYHCIGCGQGTTGMVVTWNALKCCILHYV